MNKIFVRYLNCNYFLIFLCSLLHGRMFCSRCFVEVIDSWGILEHRQQYKNERESVNKNEKERCFERTFFTALNEDIELRINYRFRIFSNGRGNFLKLKMNDKKPF